ncbi:hypothetical protein [Myxococcus qinghaiensis]|uniref:hypothetical protein n=1 Tax=Myxococcus qinghaiensis TaxID=2906758 RepID=UPI0020A7F137|nr:hypothetical protein [Myxococcus qinghaiensis]MCP3168194.1 hypothetical protein [Myxococcus qinghaiensis]
MKHVSAMLEALRQSKSVKVKTGAPIAPESLVDAITPPFGVIEWTPPPGYREALGSGLRSATRHVPAVGRERGFKLYDADALGKANEDWVHLPEGVTLEDGVDLSTNHLVGFAEAEGEAVWCFDVSAPRAGGEYPVYYHHAELPRARVLATGAWLKPEDATPDFESFAQWLETMTAALIAEPPPAWLQDLGTPGLTFTKKRLSL